MDKEFPKYVLVSVTLFFAIFLAAQILLSRQVPEGTDLLTYKYSEGTALQVHIHPWLEIWIDGENRSIPAGIGIDDEGIRVIHTHDDTGRIHVESPWPHEFYLKDFFFIWGKRFDEKCIFGYCADENHTLEVFVDGEKSQLYGDIPLADGQRIKIVYSRK